VSLFKGITQKSETIAIRPLEGVEKNSGGGEKIDAVMTKKEQEGTGK